MINFLKGHYHGILGFAAMVAYLAVAALKPEWVGPVYIIIGAAMQAGWLVMPAAWQNVSGMPTVKRPNNVAPLLLAGAACFLFAVPVMAQQPAKVTPTCILFGGGQRPPSTDPAVLQALNNLSSQIANMNRQQAPAPMPMSDPALLAAIQQLGSKFDAFAAQKPSCPQQCPTPIIVQPGSPAPPIVVNPGGSHQGNQPNIIYLPQQLQPGAPPQSLTPSAPPQSLSPSAPPQYLSPSAPPQYLQPSAPPQYLQPSPPTIFLIPSAPPQSLNPGGSVQPLTPSVPTPGVTPLTPGAPPSPVTPLTPGSPTPLTPGKPAPLTPGAPQIMPPAGTAIPQSGPLRSYAIFSSMPVGR